MAYLLKNSPDQLFFLDYSPRNGLLYKHTTLNKGARTMVLSSQSTSHYSATLDSHHQIHIACKNKQNQIVHYYQTKIGFNNEIILDDPNNTYSISNFKFISCNEDLILFYTAKNPDADTADIIQHKLNTEDTPPQSVIPVTSLQTHYDCIYHQNHLYLLSINKEDEKKHELQLSVYNFEDNEWQYYKTLATSSQPITYCTMCSDNNDNLHILYTRNQYGRYTSHFLTLDGEEDTQQIHTCPYDIQPTLFIYNNTLWVNWLENQQLYMQMSTDGGSTFSETEPCSMQGNNLRWFTYVYDQGNHPRLIGRYFFGTMDNYPKFAILSQIDMDHIHPQYRPNKELKLFVTQLSDVHRNSLKKDYSKLVLENQELKKHQNNLVEQYEELTDVTKRLQQEGKRWKNKYYDLQIELKAVESKLSKVTPPPIQEDES